MEGYNIPEKINRLIEDKPYEINEIGMSGSTILVFDDMVLKIEKYRKENDESVDMMRWLEGKIPAPKVLCYESDGEYQYLLMTKIRGEMSCSDYNHEHTDELIAILAEALKSLWKVDISDCPGIRDLDADLKEAKRRLDNNLVDMENSEPTTFGEDGEFDSPEELYQWLVDNRPEYEPVLSHGDFCLPNIFIENGKLSGFIDVGDTGIGDKWKDIALCYRSLKHNFDGTYTGKAYPDFNPDKLFEALGIEPDWDKIHYFILLDEMF